jgi:uncharacterized LabA/DUF88 family protein
MPGHTYLFIDGEYLRRIHSKAMRDFFGVDGELDLTPVMQNARAQRAYFYDSLDDATRPNETEEARRARIRPLEEFFARTRDLTGFHVRLGTVTGNSKKRRQKEVDILLAVDMLTHGFNGSMEKAVLIAGDLDFRPIVETLVRNGVFVDVWYDRSSIAADLPAAADFGVAIRFRTLYDWNSDGFRNAHRIPDEERQSFPRLGDLVKTGSLRGYDVELYRYDRDGRPALLTLWITIEPGDSIHISDEDEGLIERYVEAQYGPIEWKYNAGEIHVSGGHDD